MSSEAGDLKRSKWRTWRRNFWKSEAENPQHFYPWSRQNLGLMIQGMPPRCKALVRIKATGELAVITAKMELHHVVGANAHYSDGLTCVVPLWPWDHAKIDSDRRLNYEFVEWYRRINLW